MILTHSPHGMMRSICVKTLVPAPVHRSGRRDSSVYLYPQLTIFVSHVTHIFLCGVALRNVASATLLLSHSGERESAYENIPFDFSPPLTGGETQNFISGPKRAQVIIQSLAPSFYSTFFVKRGLNTPKRKKKQRKICERFNKPPPAGSNFVMVRHEQYRTVGCRSPPSKG